MEAQVSAFTLVFVSYTAIKTIKFFLSAALVSYTKSDRVALYLSVKNILKFPVFDP